MTTIENGSAKRVIAGLAALTGNLAEERDYIDLFVPLVAQCLSTGGSQSVSVADLQRQMKSAFGMQLPQNALKLVLNRAARKGYVKLERGTYCLNREALSRLDFALRYQDIIRQQNAAVKKLVTFASERYKIALTDIDAEKALLAYVQKHDIEILDCFLNAEGIPPSVVAFSKQLDLVISSFIVQCYESDPSGFKYVETIVKGNFLSHALFFPDLGEVKRRFHRTEVYFDTPLLIAALGYDGAARQAPCKELFELVFREGGALRCFSHTRDEIKNILQACLVDMRTGKSERGSQVQTHFKSVGLDAIDVELEIALIDRKIERLAVRVVDKPDSVGQTRIDEGKLETVLESETVYWRDKPRQRRHDADCLAAIFRLRKGDQATNIEESKAIFVTANSALCRVATRFFGEECHVDRSSAPIAVSDYVMTTLLWLKTPMAAPDLPVKAVIAECYAAVQPGERLWKKYTETVSRLEQTEKISAAEFYLLRYSQLVHRELMEATLGDESGVTESKVCDILEAVKKEIRKADLDQLKEERRLLEETRVESLTKLEEERSLREATEKKLLHERSTITDKLEGLERRLRVISWRIGRSVSIGIFVAIVGIVIFGAISGFMQRSSGWWNYILSGASFVFACLSVGNLITGFTVKDLMARLTTRLADSIEKILKRWFLPGL